MTTSNPVPVNDAWGAEVEDCRASIERQLAALDPGDAGDRGAAARAEEIRRALALGADVLRSMAR
jgi:hypothetical protein